MRMEMKIRPAQPSDAPEISQIHAASWKVAYRGMVSQKYLDELRDDFWTEKFIRWLGQGTLRAKMLFAKETPAGCTAYGKSRDEKHPDWAEIVSIYLRPEVYRKGYGTVLLQAALKDLKAQGYSTCSLWVLRENSNARRFYEKNGFTLTQDTCHSEVMEQELTDIRYIIAL